KTWGRIRKIWWPMVIITMVGLTYLLLFRQQLFVNNWHQILSGSSYFANMLHPSLTTHYWYIAVYMQFMVIWPLFFELSRRFTKTKWQSGLVMLAAALLSGILMAIVFTPGEDPSRVYYGTDTRFFSIALGGAAAQLLDMDQLATWLKDRVGRSHHFIVDVVLLGLLAILTYGMLHML